MKKRNYECVLLLLSTKAYVSFVKIDLGNRFVPMSALFTVVGTLTMIHVSLAAFFLSQFSARGRCLRPRAIFFLADARTNALLSSSMTVDSCFQPIISSIPLFGQRNM